MRHALLYCALFFILACCIPQTHAAENISGVHQEKIGDTDVWILSTTMRDQQTDVLLPKTQAQKDDIARVYPQGKMRNSLNVMLVRGVNTETTPKADTLDTGKIHSPAPYLALVDTGLPADVPTLIERIQSVGFTPDDITHVIITHAHGDHVGGLTVDGKALFPKATVIFSEAELDFWLNLANVLQVPERAKTIFSQLPDILEPYKGRIEKARPENPILPGITLIEAYGHTPGHVGVFIKAEPKTGGQSLFFWGDLVHGMKIQLAHPDVAVVYDVNPDMAIATRKKLLARAIEENWLVTGVHVPDVTPFNFTEDAQP